MIDKYDAIKHTFNILHVVSVVPHFNEYMRANGIPYIS